MGSRSKRTRMAACLCACLWLAAQAAGAQGLPRVLKRGKADSPECRAWVDSCLSAMSLREKVGQLFIHTVAPVQTPENRKSLHDAVKRYKVGGVLFSGGELPDQVVLTNEAQADADIPLLVAFDGEWGLAMRLKDMPSFPRNRVLGCISDNALIYEYGREVARQCREIGVQVNFAPVADVDVNPRNPVINNRSFGADPGAVARKVVAYCRGLEDGGVLSVCKHFPGHGDTEVDSHKALPVLDFSRARLDSVELRPFREAVDAGAGGIMTGHLEVRAWEECPASLSSRVIRGVLRQELGFRGLVFTDALEMKGVAGRGDVCVRALKAGNDMLLAPRALKRETEAVLEAVRRGELTEDLITEKCRRVLACKYALGLSRRPAARLSGLDKRLRTPATDSLVRRLSRAAVTVPLCREGVLPLDSTLAETGVMHLGSSPAAELPFCRRLRTHLPLVCLDAGTAGEGARRRLAGLRRLVVAVSPGNQQRAAALARSLPVGLPVVWVCFFPLKPETGMAACWERAGAVVVAHAAGPDVQAHVADVLAGKATADGQLSVGMDGRFRPGDGTDLRAGAPRAFRPEDCGMDSRALARIDSIALEGIQAKAYPGCQVVVWKDGKPVYNKCFGTFTYEAGSRPVERDDLYDAASLTKMAATLLAVMKLYDEGRFGLTDSVGRYVPELRGTDKARITVEDLLFHQSGLPPTWPFYRMAVDDDSYEGPFYRSRPDATHHRRTDTRLYATDRFAYKPGLTARAASADYPLQAGDSLFFHRSMRDSVLTQIGRIPLRSRAYRYSCLNFVLLREMAERLAGMPMDRFLEEQFYRPMGMRHTAFLPLRRFARERVVPTVASDLLRDASPLQGYVHDELAAVLGGVSGNAGLFTTASDAARVCQMLIDEGVWQGRRYLSRQTCRLFLGRTSRLSRRGLGFDRPDPRNPAKSPCAAEAPAEMAGHTGFTGTCAWADPKNRIVFVFMSNRVWPRPFDHKRLMTLNIRPRIQQAVYQSLAR